MGELSSGRAGEQTGDRVVSGRRQDQDVSLIRPREQVVQSRAVLDRQPQVVRT